MLSRRAFLFGSACAVGLSACGGDGTKGAASAPTWSDPLTPDNFTDERAVMHVGGTPGWVCANRWVITEVGADVTNYEWNLVAVIANGAERGENCAFYAQANARNTGNTWGAVSEVCDETYGTKSQTLIAHELDVWCSGADSLPRLGLHVVVGDSKTMRGAGQSVEAVGTEAVRISSNGNRSARWRRGVTIDDVTEVGIEFKGAPDHLLSVRPESLVKEPLGAYVGKIPIVVGGRTLFIPVYE
jgi:hypothetical protein